MAVYFGNSSGNPLADRRYDLALHLAEGGDFSAAADLLRQGLELAPHWPPFHFHLGDALRHTGHAEEARKAFQDYLALDPEDKMGAAIKLTLMGATPTPETMPVAYVRSLFDQYAPKFEKVLVEKLSYRAPQIIASEINAIYSGPFERVLDLGCGTGLAAQLFADQASFIIGVDLAPAMIEESKNKEIYTDLRAMGIEEFLTQDDTNYDLILCADVLVYIGALKVLFQQVADHMKPGALFAFTTQKSDADGWVLGEDHRYAHSEDYIARCVEQAGLRIVTAKDASPRLDAGHEVSGMVFVARKP